MFSATEAFDPNSEVGKNNLAKFSNQKDGWKKIAMLYSYRAGSGKEKIIVGRINAFKDFIKNPKNEEIAQRLWDDFGVALTASTRTGGMTIPPAVYETFHTDLSHLNKVFDVRSIVSKMGLTMRFTPEWLTQNEAKAQARFGGTTATYKISEHLIELQSPTAGGSSFVHELFHAIDSYVTVGSHAMMSDPDYFVNLRKKLIKDQMGIDVTDDHPLMANVKTKYQNAVPKEKGSLAHFLKEVLPAHHDVESSPESFKEYQGRAPERFARMIEDFTHDAFNPSGGTHTSKKESVRDPDGDSPEIGYWGRDVMAAHADQIAEQLRNIGIPVKQKYVEEVKNNKTSNVHDKYANTSWKHISDHDKQRILKDVTKDINEHLYPFMDTAEKHGTFSDSPISKEEMNDIYKHVADLNAAKMGFSTKDPRESVKALQKYIDRIRVKKSVAVAKKGFAKVLLRKSGFRINVMR